MHSATRFQWLILLVGGLLSGAAQTDGSEDGYAGTETCLVCHQELAPLLARSPHAEASRGDTSRLCESCHGPGSSHAKDPSQPIPAFRDPEPVQERSGACLGCHWGQGQQNLRQGVHETAGLACDLCHESGHGQSRRPFLLSQTEPALCVACHGRLRGEMELPFRHRTSDGVLRCSDCHNPHESSLKGRKLARQEVCQRCHADKQGPFLFEHLSVTVTGCVSCHRAHGAVNPRLLVRSEVRFLCLECHADTPRFHDLSQARFQHCTACHTAIHGSFVDGRFLR